MNSQPIKNSEFLMLIGEWKTEGRIFAKGNKPEINIRGTDRYELILEGFFILHSADVLIGKTRAEIFELIRLDDATQATFEYYNNWGESGKMAGTLQNDRFTLQGEGLRFEGRLNDDGSQLAGTWQQLDDKGHWQDFMEIKLSKLV